MAADPGGGAGRAAGGGGVAAAGAARGEEEQQLADQQAGSPARVQGGGGAGGGARGAAGGSGGSGTAGAAGGKEQAWQIAGEQAGNRRRRAPNDVGGGRAPQPARVEAVQAVARAAPHFQFSKPTSAAIRKGQLKIAQLRFAVFSSRAQAGASFADLEGEIHTAALRAMGERIGALKGTGLSMAATNGVVAAIGAMGQAEMEKMGLCALSLDVSKVVFTPPGGVAPSQTAKYTLIFTLPVSAVEPLLATMVGDGLVLSFTLAAHGGKVTAGLEALPQGAGLPTGECYLAALTHDTSFLPPYAVAELSDGAAPEGPAPPRFLWVASVAYEGGGLVAKQAAVTEAMGALLPSTERADLAALVNGRALPGGLPARTRLVALVVGSTEFLSNHRTGRTGGFVGEAVGEEGEEPVLVPIGMSRVLCRVGSPPAPTVVPGGPWPALGRTQAWGSPVRSGQMAAVAGVVGGTGAPGPVSSPLSPVAVLNAQAPGQQVPLAAVPVTPLAAKAAGPVVAVSPGAGAASPPLVPVPAVHALPAVPAVVAEPAVAAGLAADAGGGSLGQGSGVTAGGTLAADVALAGGAQRQPPGLSGAGVGKVRGKGRLGSGAGDTDSRVKLRRVDELPHGPGGSEAGARSPGETGQDGTMSDDGSHRNGGGSEDGSGGGGDMSS